MGRLVGAWTAAMAVVGSAAFAQTLQCTVSNKQRADWVTDQYLILPDTTGESVEVLDALIHHFNDGKPISATIARDTESQLRITWRLRTVASDGQVAIMIYHGTYFRKNGKFLISAKPAGFSNNFTGRGRCELR